MCSTKHKSYGLPVLYYHLSYQESNLAMCVKRHNNMHIFAQVILFLEMF